MVYKLVRKMKDGTISSLFINKKQRLPVGEWMDAEAHKTKGFAFRKGWHCLISPYAPHLTKKGRVWVAVDVQDIEFFDRPKSQGGMWVLAQRMKIIKEVVNE